MNKDLQVALALAVILIGLACWVYVAWMRAEAVYGDGMCMLGGCIRVVH